MIKSMTGFGRAETVDRERKITVELKSVNHRYLDLSIKMPRKLNFLEGAVRNLLKTYMQRGKVDVFISYEDERPGRVALKYNRELAAEYLAYLREMQREFGIADNVTATRNRHRMRTSCGKTWRRRFALPARNLWRPGNGRERISPGIFWKSLTAWRIR